MESGMLWSTAQPALPQKSKLPGSRRSDSDSLRWAFPRHLFSRTSRQPALGEDDLDLEFSIGRAHGVV